MAINTKTTLAAALAAAQHIQYTKTSGGSVLANAWFSMFSNTGTPSAGTLAGSSTAAGVVPTSSTSGCPAINSFNGNNGLVAGVEFNWTVLGRVKLFDMLFKAGAYSFNSVVTLASQPSYSGRVPGGTDFTATQIWIEFVTTFTGILNVAVTYTNQAGTTGRTTGTVTTVAGTASRLYQLPLQALDTGVQKIESVTATVATVGTFNVLVLRPLAQARIDVICGSAYRGFMQCMTQMYDTSALYVAVSSDTTSSGVLDMNIQAANG